MKRNFNAFTLAEVLITIGIIGVITVTLIPTINNIISKIEEKTRKQTEAKLSNIMKVMNAEGILEKTSSTEEFVKLLEKNTKIIKKCDSENLKDCFSEDTTYYLTKDETQKKNVKMCDLKTGVELGQFDNDTENMGIVLADGTSLILTYDLNCKINPYDNTLPVDKCLKAIYDTNGFAQPNTIGKDVGFFNANIADVESACVQIDNLCVDIQGTSFYPIEDEAVGLNYWEGAKLACENKSMRLPTVAEALKINYYMDKVAFISITSEEANSTKYKGIQNYQGHDAATTFPKSRVYTSLVICVK